MMISPASTFADNIQAKEYYVKAAFLYNFARLVEWPKNTFSNKNEPIRICLIGHDSFGDALRTIRNKKVNDRSLVIQRSVKLQNISHCHILFIDQSEKSNVQRIVNKLNQHATLTVSELPAFAHQNGHIRLFLNNDKTLSLEINLGAINQAGLKISSRILTLAKIVSSTDEALEP
ncbi:MAG: YfiR family protein [gamma proteobacterium symbiont of Bathyaustriella thionipta]|nr:YfiR family protein [gamma proteobacterium symbiont of Bathyaustriella thionipta]MCU7954622.1 YfiR family protein [gamma proteobacterium symbiont of Bathyaustriella thionipta]MCU7955202.1 YfiR family protein [gamma proteobacterium symbiont of Bathyaustriella thionipta]MCU7968250.1 YfiR family protein [gamma proteobacterium symbiont of Bathyaustriella thionipta]